MLVNVNVVPMDRERVLRRQTLIVTDGVITGLGDTKSTAVSGDAQRIEVGDNAYVLRALPTCQR